MSLDSNFNAVCSFLQSRLDLEVAVGRPNEAIPGLYVWPWQLIPKLDSRNFARHQKRETGFLRFRVHCLLLGTPADTLETISKLDLAGRVLDENPILTGSGGDLRVMLDTIPAADLATVFLAGRLQLTVSVPFVLEG